MTTNNISETESDGNTFEQYTLAFKAQLEKMLCNRYLVTVIPVWSWEKTVFTFTFIVWVRRLVVGIVVGLWMETIQRYEHDKGGPESDYLNILSYVVKNVVMAIAGNALQAVF